MTHPRSALLCLLALAMLSLAAPASASFEIEGKVTAPDPAAADAFGNSIAVSGSTAIIGAPNDDDLGLNAGSAYVFTRSGAVWSFEQKLVAPAGAAGDLFGDSVAVSGDTIVVGAPYRNGLAADTGAAYVFTRTGSVWTEQQTLVASDAATIDLFGDAVALTGDTVAVGAPNDDDLGLNAGAVYVFARSGTVWSEQQKLTASDGAAGHLLGVSVAAGADTVIVGAPMYDGVAWDSGAAFVFVRSGSTWSEQQRLTPSDAALADLFGVSVAIDDDTALVGAQFDDAVGVDAGAAYAFARIGSTWTQEQELLASDPGAGDRFGYSVGVSGDTAVIGSPLDDGVGADSGSAHVFERAGGAWTQLSKLLAGDQATGDRFGRSVAVDGDDAFVGSPGDDDTSVDSGSAYSYGTNHPPAITPIGDRTVMAGNPLTFTVVATDPDGDTVVTSADPLPTGASFDPATGVFDWTPSQVGSSSVTFTASDGSLVVSETVSMTVSAAPRPPVLEPIGDRVVREGETLLFRIVASDPNGDAITLSVTPVPSGAKLTAGLFSWDASYEQAGTHVLTFEASDGILTDTEDVTITVLDVAPPEPPTPPTPPTPTPPPPIEDQAPDLGPVGDRSVREGHALSFLVSASDPDGDPISLSATPLPSGASFSASTGRFSWTPGYGQAGVYSVGFHASAGALSDGETVTITVNDALEPWGPLVLRARPLTVERGTEVRLIVDLPSCQTGPDFLDLYRGDAKIARLTAPAGTERLVFRVVVRTTSAFRVVMPDRPEHGHRGARSNLVRVEVAS